jgi:Winged helix DNA-binding domain
MRSFTWNEVRARRLARNHLLERAQPAQLVEVVRGVGGIHAQVTASAELQLAARVEGITQADVHEVLWERRFLAKTWTLRGTLHLHPADELRLWTAARRAILGEADLEAQSPEELAAIVAAIGEALSGRELLREELADAVVERVASAPRERLLSGWGFYLGDAAEADLLCFGPPRGQKVTFVRPEDWLGRRASVEPEEALREVARRYLAAYGPATHREFRQWFSSRSFRPADAKELFEALADELEEVDVEGRRAFLLAGDVGSGFAAARGSVRLLPEYDVYVMGFRERDQLVPVPVREQVAAHGKGRYEGPAGVPFLLVDGVCAGLWTRKKTAKKVELTVEPARRLTRVERTGVEAEAERIGAFYRLPAHVRLG